MRERRARYEDDDVIIDIIRAGSQQANVMAEETLALAKAAAKLRFFNRDITLKSL